VGVQPDVVAGGAELSQAQLIELEKRVEAHQAAIDALTEAIETDPAEAAVRK
jgi:hypothetical protein